MESIVVFITLYFAWTCVLYSGVDNSWLHFYSLDPDLFGQFLALIVELWLTLNCLNWHFCSLVVRLTVLNLVKTSQNAEDRLPTFSKMLFMSLFYLCRLYFCSFLHVSLCFAYIIKTLLFVVVSSSFPSQVSFNMGTVMGLLFTSF